MPQLSDEQMQFLLEKKVPLDRVFDATGMKKTEYHQAMKELGLWVAFGVTPCRASGHSLRTRAGHCVQCDSANIGFLARHDNARQVYVAHSSSRHYTKVGSAESAEVRVKSLNNHRYGRIDDWKLVRAVECRSAAKIEDLLKQELRRYHSPRENSQSSSYFESSELFGCEPEVAVAALELILSSGVTEA